MPIKEFIVKLTEF